MQAQLDAKEGKEVRAFSGRSGAVACPCCRRQGFDLGRSGLEDGSRCTHLACSGL
jgi:hypothetical protein